MLELLQDEKNSNIISWVGTDGEFKLLDPEAVSRLWGGRKRKPSMNYDKLSRAIRYYYDKKIMHKIHGKRYVYKFNFDTISKYLSSGSPQSSLPEITTTGSNNSVNSSSSSAAVVSKDVQLPSNIAIDESVKSENLQSSVKEESDAVISGQSLMSSVASIDSLTHPHSSVSLFNLTSCPVHNQTPPTIPTPAAIAISDGLFAQP